MSNGTLPPPTQIINVSSGGPGPSGAVAQPSGPIIRTFKQISTVYTLTTTDAFVEAITATGAPIFPTAVGAQGQSYIFKNRSGSSITPSTTSGQTIDGAVPSIIANNGILRIISDGTNWLTW